MWEAAEKDLYAVLGASASDSLQQLRHRYQQLARQNHPDRLVGVSSAESESSVKNFLEVEAAWRILSNHSTRRQYDLQRRDEHMYTSCCRCGGEFSLSQEEVENKTHSCEKDEEEAPEDRQPNGVVVCCDTCSLSVYVKP